MPMVFDFAMKRKGSIRAVGFIAACKVACESLLNLSRFSPRFLGFARLNRVMWILYAEKKGRNLMGCCDDTFLKNTVKNASFASL
jgi:hypothetical protein